MTGSNMVVRDERKQVRRHDLKLLRHVYNSTEEDVGDGESKQASEKKEKIMGIRNGR